MMDGKFALFISIYDALRRIYCHRSEYSDGFLKVSWPKWYCITNCPYYLLPPGVENDLFLQQPF